MSLAGGGTDILPYAARFGGQVLSATITEYVHTSIRRTTSPCGLDATSPFHIAHRLLDCPVDPHCRYTSHSGGLAGSGLGTSSASMVAVIAAVARWHNLTLPAATVAQLAHRLERDELGQAGGAQDHYAAAFGGINFIEFRGTSDVTVTPVRVPRPVLNRLEASLLLCDTGTRRDSGRVLERQLSAVKEDDPASLEPLHRIRGLAAPMRAALLNGDLPTVAQLMSQGWREKEKLMRIPQPAVQRLLGIGAGAGALAGRLLGAGGGGFLLFVTWPGQVPELARALTAAGGRVRRVRFATGGVSVTLRTA